MLIKTNGETIYEEQDFNRCLFDPYRKQVDKILNSCYTETCVEEKYQELLEGLMEQIPEEKRNNGQKKVWEGLSNILEQGKKARIKELSDINIEELISSIN